MEVFVGTQKSIKVQDVSIFNLRPLPCFTKNAIYQDFVLRNNNSASLVVMPWSLINKMRQEKIPERSILIHFCSGAEDVDFTNYVNRKIEERNRNYNLLPRNIVITPEARNAILSNSSGRQISVIFLFILINI